MPPDLVRVGHAKGHVWTWRWTWRTLWSQNHRSRAGKAQAALGDLPSEAPKPQRLEAVEAKERPCTCNCCDHHRP